MSTRTRVKPNIGGWVETDTQAAGIATAARAAETGKIHVVTGVSGSFSSTEAGALLTILDGAAIIYNEMVYDAGGMSFSGIEITKGNACSAELAAGTGTGAVNLEGYTI